MHIHTHTHIYIHIYTHTYKYIVIQGLLFEMDVPWMHSVGPRWHRFLAGHHQWIWRLKTMSRPGKSRKRIAQSLTALSLIQGGILWSRQATSFSSWDPLAGCNYLYSGSLQVVIWFAKLGLSENRAAQNLMELIITFPYFGHQSGHIFGLNSHFRKNPTGPPKFLNSSLSPRSSTASVPSYCASWRVSGRNVARAMPRSWGMGDGPGQKLEKRGNSTWKYPFFESLSWTNPCLSVRFPGSPSIESLNVTFYLFKGLTSD